MSEAPHHKIVEALLPLALPINMLFFDANNARVHPERNLCSIQASLETYGQRKPVVVRREGCVVEAGNGTLAAARALGWTHVAAVLVDDDPLTATGYAIADNRTAELATWDDAKLAGLLKELSVPELDLDLAALGWSDEELKALMDSIPAFQPVAASEQHDLDNLTPKPCPHCGKDTRVAPGR